MPSEFERAQMQFDEAIEWVKSYSGALPTDLATLSAYPMQFRRVIINQVSPEIRAAMWRDHLQSFLVSQAELADNDQVFLQNLIADLPAAFIGPAETARERFTAFSNRCQGRFSPALARRLFQTIGPPEPAGGIPSPPATAS